MSSSIYYQFRSQREPLRINFDGTGISIFDLKREIILANKLGDGTDFDLSVYNADTNDEYEDDAEILPRSSSVIVRRKAPSKQGHGTAARYASAKAPPMSVVSGNSLSGRRAADGSGGGGYNKRVLPPQPTVPIAQSTGPVSAGDDDISAMLAAESENWANTQNRMAAATPVYGRGNNSNRPQRPAPDHPPPPTYICHRCFQKGHWIYNCPTNNDPTFENVRAKRTTGIPKSFLKTVSKDEISAMESGAGGSGNGLRDHVRVNENGEYVVVRPDSAAWQSYLQKQTAEDDGEHDGSSDGEGAGERKRKRSRRAGD